MCIDELEDWRKAKALDPEAAGVTGRDAAPLPRLQPYSDAYERHLDANGYAKPNGLPRQLECGQNSVLDADLVGCGKAINDSEIFRCVDCSVPFHRECARKHFIAGESVLTAAMVDEQSRRDNSREGLRIVCSARDYLNEQIPKDWTATELLNSLWGTFMKEQSSWKKLASLPVGESTREKCDMCSQPLDAQVEFLNRELANFRRNAAFAAQSRWISVEADSVHPENNCRCWIFVRGIGWRTGFYTALDEFPWKVNDSGFGDKYPLQDPDVAAWLEIKTPPMPKFADSTRTQEKP